MRVRPAHVSLPLDQKVSFSAGLYNSKEVQLNTGRVVWAARNKTEHRAARVSPDGTFTARFPGKYTISASAGKHKGRVTVVVPDGIALDPTANPVQPPIPVSSRGDARGTPPKLPAPPESSPAWQDENFRDAFVLSNRRGHDPLRRRTNATTLNADAGLGNGNFLLQVPVLDLAGRGKNVSLNLFYNSKVWLKTNYNDVPSMVFNHELGFPAPGWSLGFGKAVQLGSSGVGLEDADGTVHQFAGDVLSFCNSADTSCNKDLVVAFKFHSIDGTLLDAYFSFKAVGGFVDGLVRYPNGTTVQYGAPGYYGTVMYPTGITDRNGNHIAIAYRRDSGPQIETITDTLGRAINFHYDANDLLIAITAPGVGDCKTSGGTREVVRFHYSQVDLKYAFDPSIAREIVRPGDNWRVDTVYFPGTSTGYWFGDPESYSSYGMIAKVSQRRGMSLQTTSLTDQGTLDNNGNPTRERTYNYPLIPDSTLSDAPTYTQMTERWAGMDTKAPAVTTYAVRMNDNPRRIQTTYPDGTCVVQLLYNHPSQFDDGLLYDEKTFASASCQAATTASTAGSPKPLHGTTTKWESGDYDSPRIASIQRTNEVGNSTLTKYIYDEQSDAPTPTNLLNEIQELDYDGSTVLRRTCTRYVTDATYANRHIFNLPQNVELFGMDPDPKDQPCKFDKVLHSQQARQSLITYQYDERVPVNAPGVVGHSDAFNRAAPTYIKVEDYHCKPTGWCTASVSSPQRVHDPQEVANDYDPQTNVRGNVTTTTRYADAAAASGGIVETSFYDMAGNLGIDHLGCCDNTMWSYNVATQYAYPEAITRGVPTDTRNVLGASFCYDFNTGLKRASTDSNGRTTRYDYDAALRPSQITLPTAATINYFNDDAMLTTTKSVREADGELVGRTVTKVDGRGLVRETRTLAPGGVWNAVAAKYDLMGRQTKRSQPFACEPDDNDECRNGTDLWNEVTFDALGRTIVLAGADGSQTHYYYNESTRPDSASSDAGQTVRVVDPVGRERWSRTNALGQLVEVIEPNPNGKGSVLESGGLKTTYQYNALGLLLNSTQGSARQQRIFEYDSLGRLKKQHLPEKGKTLTDDGGYDASAGKWSDIFAYDERSNLISHTDGRGIKALYEYNDDPLDRLQKVSYDVTGFGDKDHPVTRACPVTYEYMKDGDVTRLSQVRSETSCVAEQYNDDSRGPLVTTQDGIVEQYGYDSEGRLTSKTLGFPNTPPFVQDYDYDSLNRLSNERYPAEYGIDQAHRQTIHYEYAIGGLLKKLQVDGEDYVSRTQYNHAGQLTSMQVGPQDGDPTSDTFSYDPKTGLLDAQLVQRKGHDLLNLSYEYFPGGQLQQLSDVKHVNGVEEENNWQYSYDPLSRLQSVSVQRSVGESSKETYSFDEYGNRAGVQLSPGTVSIPLDGVSSRTYDQQTNHANDFAYDAAGNVTLADRVDSAGKHSMERYRYDWAGRLSMATDDSGKVTEAYVYGLDRRRLKKTIQIGEQTPVFTLYAWDGNHVAAEYSPNRDSLQWSKSILYLGDHVLATFQPGEAKGTTVVSYHHQDRLGTRLITNNADGSFEQLTMPFGTLIPTESANPINPIFTSYDRSSATGLDYAVNREYDQQAGFIQPDPAQTMSNLYAYSASDPINKTDPSGLRETNEFSLPLIGQENLLAYAYFHGDPGCWRGSESACGGGGFGGGWAAPGNDTFVGLSGATWQFQPPRGTTSSDPGDAGAGGTASGAQGGTQVTDSWGVDTTMWGVMGGVEVTSDWGLDLTQSQETNGVQNDENLLTPLVDGQNVLGGAVPGLNYTPGPLDTATQQANPPDTVSCVWTCMSNISTGLTFAGPPVGLGIAKVFGSAAAEWFVVGFAPGAALGCLYGCSPVVPSNVRPAYLPPEFFPLQ
jgi:RHS repeat-associated protein